MSKVHLNNLTAKQEQAIVSLLSEPSVTRAAASAGVHEKTIYRWLEKKEFASQYRKARREAFSHAVAMTQKYAPAAVAALTSVMADKNAPAAARVQAASTLLRFGRQGIELDDLAARVEALETSQEEETP